ncbi:MAG: DUF4190 domain-containing protein [Ruminococcus sp.]|uniref:DUF4190 domain-containing protein n=1 Tax=Ruminococcus sp. TaxID=41978 RepID=UPI001B1F1B99|nr:DUF4190 domain-containing protein [Ruminococcus sp.]MBO7472837.1 DUF4190 domain-containing protein [Ruminococcus sp.]
MDDFSSNNNYNGYGGNGYNNSPGGYGSNGGGGYFPDGQFHGMYGENYDMPEQKGAGLAIASFVISLVNLIICGTLLTIITAPLCIIFSLVSLIGKRKGKVFAIIGMIISVLSLAFFAYFGFIIYKIVPDMVYFVNNSTQIIEEYDRDGSIPEQFEKYRDPKYDKYWDKMGYKSFDDYFANEWIEKYRVQSTGSSYSSAGNSASLSSGFALAYIE